MQDSVILITGAASGYGAAMSLACGQAGATVILLDQSIKKLEQQYDAMCQAGCPEPALLPVNLAGADAEGYDTIIAAVQDNFAKLDGLVLNAAEFAGLTPLRNFSPERWYRTLQTNLTANFHLIQMLLPLLEVSESGRVVYVHDVVADTREAYWGAYSVTKAAMLAMMETYQQEFADQQSLRFITVRPEPMRTGIRQRISPAGKVSGVDPSTQTDLVIQALTS